MEVMFSMSSRNVFPSVGVDPRVNKYSSVWPFLHSRSTATSVVEFPWELPLAVDV